MKSIITDKDTCYLCGRRATETHHIFGASNRKFSEKYGLKVPLCHWCHNEPPFGVHHNRENDLVLKRVGQTLFTKYYPSENFVEIFGRNYK